MKNKDAGVIVLLSLILGFIFNYLFNGKLVGLSYFVFITLVAAVFLFFVHYSKQRLSKQTILLILAILFFSSMVVIRASFILTFFNIVATVGLSMLVVQTQLGRDIRRFALSNYIYSFVGQALIFMRKSIAVIADAFDNKSKKGSMLPFFRGLIIVLPFLIIFIVLFSSADLAFSNFFEKIFDLKVDLVDDFFLVVIPGLAIAGALSFAFLYRTDHNKEEQTFESERKLNNIDFAVIYGLVISLFLVFILVQVNYLFGGQENIAKLGYTYADYARRGFFELIGVAVVCYGMIFLTEKFARPESKVFKILSTTLIIEVLLVVFSALKRLSLYVDAYGLTQDRFYAAIFVFLVNNSIYLFRL